MRVGLPSDSRSVAKARAAGLTVETIPDIAKWADVLMLLIPDTRQAEVYTRDIQPHLTPGKMLMFAHGFNIRFGTIVPSTDIDVTMVAPKAPGHRMRATFEEGNGVPGLIAIQQDASGNARELTLAYARGIGCTRAGVLNTTFKEETETDLFGEQVVLCGGLTELIRAGFDTLVEAGYRVVSPYRPGTGGSDYVDFLSKATVSQDNWALLDCLGIEKAVLVGHCGDARMAWQMYLTRPLAVDAFINSDSGLFGKLKPRKPYLLSLIHI